MKWFTRDWCYRWNDLVRDAFTVVSIGVTGLGALLTVDLPNTTLATLTTNLEGAHPYLWPAFLYFAMPIFGFFLFLLIRGDREKEKRKH